MPSKVLNKLQALDKKLNKVEDIEEKLERLVNKEDKEVSDVEKEEKKIEARLLQIGNFTVKRSHLLELARGAAGAFLGVGLGQALGGSISLARVLPWVNILGIFLFIIILVGVLIYKNDQDQINSSGQATAEYILKKMLSLYLISLAVQLLGLVLFNNYPGFGEVLFKALIIGSYSAMSSAVAFTLI